MWFLVPNSKRNSKICMVFYGIVTVLVGIYYLSDDRQIKGILEIVFLSSALFIFSLIAYLYHKFKQNKKIVVILVILTVILFVAIFILGKEFANNKPVEEHKEVPTVSSEDIRRLQEEMDEIGSVYSTDEEIEQEMESASYSEDESSDISNWDFRK